MFISDEELGTIQGDIKRLKGKVDCLESLVNFIRNGLIDAGLFKSEPDAYHGAVRETDLKALIESLNLVKVEEPAKVYYKKGETK